MNSVVRSASSGVRRGFLKASSTAGALLEVQRSYRHWNNVTAHDFGLPVDSMPFDMDSVFKKNPKDHDLYENYWYAFFLI